MLSLFNRHAAAVLSGVVAISDSGLLLAKWRTEWHKTVWAGTTDSHFGRCLNGHSGTVYRLFDPQSVKRCDGFVPLWINPGRHAVNVSVIIPVLDEALIIESAIQRAWSAGADDVIVSDGGSGDETVAIATRQPCQIVHGRRGRAVQQNHGAAISDGDVLVFLHADTWLAPGAIQQVRDVLDGGNLQGGAFRQNIEARGLPYRLLERGNAARVRLLGLAYGDQGIFVRRETFDGLGRFPDVSLMEDLRFMRRFRQLSRPVLLPGPLHVSARRWQRHGVVRQTLRNWTLLTAEKCGVPPNRLARFYARR